ncbi:RimJ/RimL family protein N-acetyltransferase [Scopulibacillus darangshiensis]|uniref:RimJ/RimL family protein N-acetyltransferase n=1 Tax=Scopulibacillus darangshiensis TaxID=442528 RepID=A0A4R2ND31_9BACL|nr:GNAT family protein [Scopulibacillus darangshiensis]TCP19149.1 RimJ/RimL family protein N-acetyltransferase [Scopulibacillus darangshiensis]
MKFYLFNNELDELIDFMTSEKWVYHSNPDQTKEKIMANFESGWYSKDKQTFWVENEGEKIGYISIFDLSDNTPLFDIRLKSKYRNKGFGEKCVLWLTDYVFTTLDNKIRVEAHTRMDNYPMRKVLHKCGYVKESHHRKAWENADGTIVDSVGYAIIRDDWEKGIKTPIHMDDVWF